MGSEKCSVGLLDESKCHLTTYSKTIGIEYIKNYANDERDVFMWRTGLSMLNIEATTCPGITN